MCSVLTSSLTVCRLHEGGHYLPQQACTAGFGAAGLQRGRCQPGRCDLRGGPRHRHSRRCALLAADSMHLLAKADKHLALCLTALAAAVSACVAICLLHISCPDILACCHCAPRCGASITLADSQRCLMQLCLSELGRRFPELLRHHIHCRRDATCRFHILCNQVWQVPFLLHQQRLKQPAGRSVMLTQCPVACR